MTSEIRTFIELSDLAAIEFGCPKCKATVAYSLNERPSRLPDKCPNCFEPFYAALPPAPQRDPSASDQLTGWIEKLCDLKNHKDIKAALRFHVNVTKV
jgi:hypothetical protein